MSKPESFEDDVGRRKPLASNTVQLSDSISEFAPKAKPNGSLSDEAVLDEFERLERENQRLRQATRNIKAFLAGRNDLPELRRAARAEAAK